MKKRADSTQTEISLLMFDFYLTSFSVNSDTVVG